MALVLKLRYRTHPNDKTMLHLLGTTEFKDFKALRISLK